jgi:predicted MFS family arabinose efflux permease
VIRRVFKAFTYHDFRLMWIGACTSSVGNWMQILAQSWLVYRLSHSAAWLGLDAFFAQIPIFLFSLFGGVFADRHSRRSILLGSQVVQMVCAFILAILDYAQVVQVWHIWCLSFTVGLAQSFGGPAYSALIPMLVKKEDMSNAIALNSIQFNLARVLGPMLGGIALDKFGAFWCFTLNGLSFIAVIATLLMIHPEVMRAEGSKMSVIQSIKDGLSFIREREGLQSLVALAFILTLLSYPLITFLPVMAKDVLHGGANTFTILLSVSGIGSIAGALTIAGMDQRSQARRSIMAMGVLGIFVAAFGLSRNLGISSLFIFITGAAMMVVFASNTSVVQLRADDSRRGRVMSVYNVAFRGGMPIGSAICGGLIEKSSAPMILAANGALILLVAFYFIAFQRKLLNL